MTKNILHAIKKLLRIGVVVTIVTSGSVNASAQENISNLNFASYNNQLSVTRDGTRYLLIDHVMTLDTRGDEASF